MDGVLGGDYKDKMCTLVHHHHYMLTDVVATSMTKTEN